MKLMRSLQWPTRLCGLVALSMGALVAVGLCLLLPPQPRLTLNVEGVVFYAWAPDGRTLAIVHWPPHVSWEIGLWDSLTGEKRRVIHSGDFNPYLIAFSADASRLAASDNEVCRVWDVSTGKEVSRHALFNRLKGGDSLRTLVFDRDQQIRVATFEDDWCKVWNLANRELLAKHPFDDSLRQSPIVLRSTLFLPEENRFQVWDLNTGERTIQVTPLPKDWQLMTTVGLSDDGTTFLGTMDEQIFLWNPGQNRMNTFPGQVTSILQLSSDGRWLVGYVTLDGDTWFRKLMSWIVPQGDACQQFVIFDAHSGREVTRISSMHVGISPDSKSLVVMGENSTLRIYDLPLRAPLFIIAPAAIAAWMGTLLLAGVVMRLLKRGDKS